MKNCVNLAVVADLGGEDAQRDDVVDSPAGAFNFQYETGLSLRVADADDLAVVIGGRLAGEPRINRKGRKGRKEAWRPVQSSEFKACPECIEGFKAGQDFNRRGTEFAEVFLVKILPFRVLGASAVNSPN